MWSYLYFPGDPPIFDLFFEVGVAISACGVVIGVVISMAGLGVSLLARRHMVRAWTKTALVIATTVFLIGAIVALPGGIVIAYRHGPAWREVRHAIRDYGARIEAARGPRRGTLLRPDEFETVRQEHVPTPVSLRLHGWGPVTLRMAHGLPPYVGIDFGGGGHALFEPITMRCIYSD